MNRPSDLATATPIYCRRRDEQGKVCGLLLGLTDGARLDNGNNYVLQKTTLFCRGCGGQKVWRPEKLRPLTEGLESLKF